MKNVPWRMILILALLVLVALFSGFNLNPVDISIGFYVFKEVPLFLALIAAFIAGAVLMVPFTLLQKKPKKLSETAGQLEKPKKKNRRGKGEEPQPQATEETISEG